MPVDVTSFLLSLASAMASAAPVPTTTPATPPVTLGGNLWAHQAIESPGLLALPAYAVLRLYGGPAPEELWRIDRISIQMAAHSKNVTAATRLAWQLYEALHNGETPQYNWSIPGVMLDASGAVVADATTTYNVALIILAAPPGAVGIDDRGMSQVSFNFDARFFPVPVS